MAAAGLNALAHNLTGGQSQRLTLPQSSRSPSAQKSGSSELDVSPIHSNYCKEELLQFRLSLSNVSTSVCSGGDRSSVVTDFSSKLRGSTMSLDAYCRFHQNRRFKAPDLIKKKRDRRALTKLETEFMITSCLSESDDIKFISDEQSGAYLMACYINGLQHEEHNFFSDQAILDRFMCVDSHQLLESMLFGHGILPIPRELSSGESAPAGFAGVSDVDTASQEASDPGTLSTMTSTHSTGFSASKIISKKAHGLELSDLEIEFMISGVAKLRLDEDDAIDAVDGLPHGVLDVTRYQFGAFLMAVYLKNMTVDETISMAKYMLRSGDRISWHQFSQPMVDVHLAPCVGDSTLLSLAPCLAAVGLKIPSFDDQAAINKLKTIPGYDPNLLTDTKEVRNVLKSVGCFIGAATEKIVPAEEMFSFAMDSTSTSDHFSLCAARAVAKKAACGASRVLFDVKLGSGVGDIEDIGHAREYANLLIGIAAGLGMSADVVITRSDEPIGNYIGNTLEIQEAVHVLSGNGPRVSVELVTTLGAQMLLLTEKVTSRHDAVQLIENAINNGAALRKFEQMVVSSGAGEEVVKNLCAKNFFVLEEAGVVTSLAAEESGYVKKIDASALQTVLRDLATAKPDKTLAWKPKQDQSVGIQITVFSGDFVKSGDVWCKIHHNRNLDDVELARLKDSIEISKQRVRTESPVVEIISKNPARRLAATGDPERCNCIYKCYCY